MIKRLLFHNFRIVYALSHWMRHRFTPAGLLIFSATIAAAIFGVDTRQTLSFQVFSLSATCLILSALCVFTFRGNFRVRRQLPEFGSAGQELRYRVFIDNPTGKYHKELLLIDELETKFPTFREFSTAHDPQDRNRNWFDRTIGYPRLMGLLYKKRGATIVPVEIKNIPAGEQVEINVEMQPLRRGYLHFFRSRIARPDPFGLFRAMRDTIVRDSVLILPRTYKVPVIQLQGKRKYQQGGLNQASTVGDSQEFMSLRDYQSGDPIRAIHWRSYAKLGKPVVKEYQDEFFVRQGLVLDTFIEDKSNILFEEAVSVAASVALSTHDQDSLLDLMFVGADAYCFTTGRGLGKTENMLEILACVQPCSEKPFSDLHNMLLTHTRDMSGLVCVLLDWDDKRRKLIKHIVAAGIPVFIFLLTEQQDGQDPDPGPMYEHPERLIKLGVENIQGQLDALQS